MLIKKLAKFFEVRSSGQILILGLAGVGLIGFLDHITGYELSFSIFYLAPIALVTWYAQKWAGFSICVASGIVWLLVEYSTGSPHSFWLIPYWNAAVRLVFFLVTAYLLAEIKARLNYERKLARIDDLTQVLNARAFDEVATRILKLAARYHHTTAVGYIDLDNFKAINDRWGHSEGDRVLKTVAGTLVRSARGTDVVGRLGGDEFVIVMPEISLVAAQLAFERIRSELRREVAQYNWPVSFSFGVAVFPDAPITIDAALKVADSLMYQVKESGKNNIQIELYNEDDADRQDILAAGMITPDVKDLS